MPVSRKTRNGSSQQAIILALILAAPAAASQIGNDPSAVPQAQSAPVAAAAPAVDPRARAAWLEECRRRMGLANAEQSTGKKKRKVAELPREPVYDYCEAYFDDYYRIHRQQNAAAPVAKPFKPMTEVISDEYVPVRSGPVKKKARRATRRSGR
jgi:hypothetical protein